MKRTFTTLCAASLLVALPAAAFDELRPGTEQPGRRFSAGMELSRGDYGLSQDTTIIYVPFSYRQAVGGGWQLGVTAPWISIDGPGTVTRDLGRFGGGGASRSESGIGDIIVSATHALAASADGSAGLDFTGKVKLGTASRSKGLGTGEEDLHVELQAYGKTGDITPFATLGYKIHGDPPGINLRDVLYLEAGAWRRVGERRTAGLMWRGQERVVSGVDPKSEAVGFYLVRLDVEWTAQFYGLIGLADGSPDLGAGAFLIRRF
jgi:hypothetical protein